jgi:hypothetical protein
MLCACGGSRLPIGAQRIIPQIGLRTADALSDWQKASDSRYQIIYNFKGTPDGQAPFRSASPRVVVRDWRGSAIETTSGTPFAPTDGFSGRVRPSP